MADVSEDEDECPGEGKCHGPMGWCDNCGDVKHICPERLRGERCDAHPVPPEWSEIRAARKATSLKFLEAQSLQHEASIEHQIAEDNARARRAFDAQRQAEEDDFWKALAS